MGKLWKGVYIGVGSLLVVGLTTITLLYQPLRIKDVTIKRSLNDDCKVVSFVSELYDKDGIKDVTYFLDGKPANPLVKEGRVYSSKLCYEKILLGPYGGCNEHSATLEKGKHTLKVVLEDRLGNKAEATRDFEFE